MKFITKKWLVLLLSGVLVMAGLLVVGCDDNGAGGGGSGGSYDFVELGGLKWMTKNLNEQTANSWCYDNKPANCAMYGRLYTWEAAKTACQAKGWRLPSLDDWTNLRMVVNGKFEKFKSTSGWNDYNGTNETGFSALPGGCRRGGNFYNAGEEGNWWTATGSVESDDHAIRVVIYDFSDHEAGYNNHDKSDGYSVRCVME